MLNNANDHFEDYYSLCETFGIFLMDTMLYLATYYYFSHLFPGAYGTARPFYFPFMVTTFAYRLTNEISNQFPLVIFVLSQENFNQSS